MSEMKHSMFLYQLYAHAIYWKAPQLAVSRPDSKRIIEYPTFMNKITCFSLMVFVLYLDVGVDFISGRQHVYFLHRKCNFNYRIFG